MPLIHSRNQQRHGRWTHVRSKKEDCPPPGSPIAQLGVRSLRARAAAETETAWSRAARRPRASPLRLIAPAGGAARHTAPHHTADGQPLVQAKPGAAAHVLRARTPARTRPPRHSLPRAARPAAGRPKKGMMRKAKRLSTLHHRARRALSSSICCGRLRPWKFLDFGGRSTPAEEKARMLARNRKFLRSRTCTCSFPCPGRQRRAPRLGLHWVPAVPCARRGRENSAVLTAEWCRALHKSTATAAAGAGNRRAEPNEYCNG